jgi:hypothetical protein
MRAVICKRGLGPVVVLTIGFSHFRNGCIHPQMAKPPVETVAYSHRVPPTSLAGVRDAKVKTLKTKKGSVRQRLPKTPLPSEDATDLQEQSAIYLRERNQQMRLKRMREEIELAVTRDQLIEKALAAKQLGYLLVAIRQKLLALPLSIGNRFGDRKVPIREVVEYAKRLINETLVECSRLPECVGSDWLEKLEEVD